MCTMVCTYWTPQLITNREVAQCLPWHWSELSASTRCSYWPKFRHVARRQDESGHLHATRCSTNTVICNCKFIQKHVKLDSSQVIRAQHSSDAGSYITIIQMPGTDTLLFPSKRTAPSKEELSKTTATVKTIQFQVRREIKVISKCIDTVV